MFPAVSAPDSVPTRNRATDRRGFTLIELMIVIVVLGILATLGIANYHRMKQNADRASCRVNQRHVCEAGILYGIDNDVQNAVVNVNVLQVGGYLANLVGECPESPNPDFDDYQLTFVAGDVDDVECTYRGAAHDWAPHN